MTSNEAPLRIGLIGAGGNMVFVSPEHSLVVVTRWAGDPNGVIERVIKALR